MSYPQEHIGSKHDLVIEGRTDEKSEAGKDLDTPGGSLQVDRAVMSHQSQKV